jgi:RimJ/RimL family protein N-acetyltransferase
VDLLIVETPRLLLPLITADDVTAVLDGPRQPAWAADFPADGDLELARLISRAGIPTGLAADFGHRLVVERDGGAVVGGIGLFGAPTDGRVEIGYGIVPSRRGRGYATEAVRGMLRHAFGQPDVDEVIAFVDPANPASVRVLTQTGFAFVSADAGGEARYAVRAPTPGISTP